MSPGDLSVRPTDGAASGADPLQTHEPAPGTGALLDVAGDDATRRLAVLAHLAGVLGVTIVGWIVAAAVSGAVVYVAGGRRSRYLVLHAGQACIYQLAVFAVDVIIMALLVAGFLYYVDDLPGMPNIASIYVNESLATFLAIAWVVLGLLTPVWHLLTVYWAARAAIRAARQQPVEYPFVTPWIEDRVLPAELAVAAGADAAGHEAGDEAGGEAGKEDGVRADADPDAGWRPPPREVADPDAGWQPPPKEPPKEGANPRV